MSWREFMVLVKGLGPQSTTILTTARRRRSGGAQRVEVMQTTEQAERRFAELFGPKRTPEVTH